MKRINIIRYLYYIIEVIFYPFRGVQDLWGRREEILRKWKEDWKRFKKHFGGFGCIWIVLLCIIICSVFFFFNILTQWWWIKVLAYLGIAIIIFVLTVTKRPMNIVYGLIGTSGSIQKFFLSFIIINSFFAGIYYLGFFEKAEISYDLNQPHVRFRKPDYPQCAQKDTVFIYSDYGNSYFLQELPRYQRIDAFLVVRNTIMTSFIQEPTDLFDAAITYNEAMYDTTGMATKDKKAMNDQAQFDKERSELFHSILILQILISWILLGVFISILYTKFRYDS